MWTKGHKLSDVLLILHYELFEGFIEKSEVVNLPKS